VELAQVSKKSRLEEKDAAAAALAPDDDDVKLVVPFEACLQSYFSEEQIEMFNLGAKVEATRASKFLNFPRYLMIKLGRYTIDSSWRQVKIDASVPVPDILDLNHLRATGLQPGEEPMAETQTADAPGQSTTITPDEGLVAQLVSMGFSENGCRRAAIATKNADAEVAMQCKK
jgi:ubiquitin carboxyl-terminal hydrolase 5/13